MLTDPDVLPIAMRRVRRLRDGADSETDDCLVVEEPLEIRLGDRPFTVTMRTPGHDLDLVRGLLLTEGVIRSGADIGMIRYCDSFPEGVHAGEEARNTVVVRLRTPVQSAPYAPVRETAEAPGWQRTLMSGASCGLCGKATLAAVMAASPAGRRPDFVLSRSLLASLPGAMASRQKLFDRTGGLHAAGIWTASGECLAVYEDIGRHNAADKAIGCGVREGWMPLRSGSPSPFPGEGRDEVASDSTPINGMAERPSAKRPSRTKSGVADKDSLILLVSGRSSFEIVQKALVAGIGAVCSVSAASSLAVDLAAAGNMILVGFLRGAGMTVYTGADRII